MPEEPLSNNLPKKGVCDISRGAIFFTQEATKLIENRTVPARHYSFPKVVLFDLDGTLIETMDSFADIAARLIESNFGISFNAARRKYITTSGIPFKDQLELMFPKNEKNFDVQKEFEEQKQDAFFSTKPSADVIKTIHDLQNLGIKTVVSSNNYSDLVLRYFDEFDTFKFDLILGYKDGFAKGKDHLLYVQEAFDIHEEEMIFVGDSLHDGAVAKELGIPFIGKIGTRTEKEFLERFPDIVCVKNLSEITLLFSTQR